MHNNAFFKKKICPELKIDRIKYKKEISFVFLPGSVFGQKETAWTKNLKNTSLCSAMVELYSLRNAQFSSVKIYKD